MAGGLYISRDQPQAQQRLLIVDGSEFLMPVRNFGPQHPGRRRSDSSQFEFAEDADEQPVRDINELDAMLE